MWKRDGRTVFAFPSLSIYEDPTILASRLAGHRFPNNIIFNHACYYYFPKYLLKVSCCLGFCCEPKHCWIHWLFLCTIQVWVWNALHFPSSHILVLNTPWILLFPLISLSLLLSVPYYERIWKPQDNVSDGSWFTIFWTWRWSIINLLQQVNSLKALQHLSNLNCDKYCFVVLEKNSERMFLYILPHWVWFTTFSLLLSSHIIHTGFMYPPV